jgi:hypothetical protein
MREASCPSCQSTITLDAQERRTGQVQCPDCFGNFTVAASPAAEEDEGVLEEAEGYRLAGGGGAVADENGFRDVDDDGPSAPALPAMPRKKKPGSVQGGSRKPAGRKAPAKPAASIPPQLLIAGGAAAFGLLVIIGIVVLLLLRGGDGEPGVAGNDAAGANAAAADLTKAGQVRATLDLSRKPQPGANSWVPADGPTSADPNKWQAAPDPAGAPAGEVRTLVSVLPDPKADVYGLAVQPNAGQWGTLVSQTWERADGESARGVMWRRYRFSDAEPFEQVSLVPDKKADDHAPATTDRVAVSPSGDRVAFPSVRRVARGDEAAVRRGAGVDQTSIEVWDKSGARVGSFVLTGLGTRSRTMVRGLHFGGEDRVWVCIGSDNETWDPRCRLALWEISKGEEVMQVAEQVHGHPGISPGGAYIACILEDRLSVRTAADGREVGVISKDADLIYGGVDFHPSGDSLAAVMGDGKGDQYVSVWSLRDGRQTDRFFRQTSGAESNIGGIRWLGDRVLGLLDDNYRSGGEIFDLDLQAVVCEFNLGEGVALPRGMPAPQPRLWHIRQFHPHEFPKLEDKLVRPPEGFKALALTVASLPDEYTGALAKARNGGVLWHPGAPCRLEIVGNFIEHKQMADRDIESLLRTTADRTATLGYHLDDQAPVTLELKLTTGDFIDYVIATRIVKDGKGVVRSREVLGPGAAIQLLKGGSEPRLPPLLLRDAQLKQVFLPNWFKFGADGEFSAEVTFPEDRPDITHGPQTVD